jgi:eukaryotic-like serine/threonine-protein kinase
MSGSRPKPVRVGDVIGGKYRVEKTLGEGGIGMVVRARHLELRQPVAIKALLLSDDDEQVARFMREARASVQLRSEHVAKVNDVGRLADGTPYMVMEYLDGEDLGAIAERNRMSLEQAVGVLLQACEGIAEAHALGIVHRDLKPRNLFLTHNARGRPLVKVLDFGLAKTFGAIGKDSHVTGSMTIAGSPPYMSPEQVRALRDVDVRTDIWALGVCLYELMTGRTPFEAPTIPEVCARILMDHATPIEHWLPDVAPGARQIIERCLLKDRSGRFANLWELALALEPFGPPEARGAADRVREALFAAPPRELPAEIDAHPPVPTEARSQQRADGETRTAFHTAHERRTLSARWPIVAVVAAAAIVGLGGAGAALKLARGRTAASAAPSVQASALAPVEPPPAATLAPLPDAGAARSGASSSEAPTDTPPAAPRRAPTPKPRAPAHPESTRM